MEVSITISVGTNDITRNYKVDEMDIDFFQEETADILESLTSNEDFS